MKALIFHPALAPYRVDFFNSLNEYYSASFYFSLKNVSDQKFNQENLKSLCNFKCNYVSNGFEILGRSIRTGVFSIIKKENPDIIFCAEYSQITLLTFLYCKIKNPKIKIYTLSDDSIKNSEDRKGLRLFFRNFISKNINGVVFTSKEVSNWYKTNVSNKSNTLDFPVIHSEKSLLKKYSNAINQANVNIGNYNLKNKKVLLYVGRLVDVKNLFFLIKCFSNVKGKDKKLVLVGEGVLKEKLIEFTQKLGILEDVLFIGRKEGVELYNWYLFSQLFVLPSTYEPFGAVVNEALVGGCRVLCSDLAGASSLINKKNGVLFNPNEENDLSTKLKQAFDEVKPLGKSITELRESAMPFTFDQKMQDLLKNI
ncbi:glycosyltransferase [Polaribacter sp. 20A6]|uniref:glycosyltransferase n=1 Tax=Polaribacter sp. 20A6 TaxID=2687289 RepID=UPI0013FE4D80|nr:glycosyltransferase [Polaribacter sp. 20A6]